MVPPQLRLVIEKVDVRWPARHEEVDDALGLGGMMEQAQRPGPPLLAGRGETLFVQEGCERGEAEAGGTAAEKAAAVKYSHLSPHPFAPESSSALKVDDAVDDDCLPENA